jgi:uncharacterized protein YbjT (DUF2867 family)
MYAITGATGNIGSKVAEALLARGERVRLISRDAARLQRFVERGAEPAVGNLLDVKFLTEAFTGARAVFALIPPNYGARDFRAYQGLVGNAIATAIGNAGVTHVVNLSSQGADLPRGTGPILGLRDQEERLNSLRGVNILHLRPTYFMENLLATIPLIHEKGVAGSAVRGDVRFAMIATRDIAARVVGHLLGLDFAGKSFRDLLGQRDLTLEEAFTVIGRRIGISDLKYVQFGYDDVARAMVESGFSANTAALMVEMARALNGGLFSVNRPRTAENSTPTAIEEFAGLFAAAFRRAAPRRAA